MKSSGASPFKNQGNYVLMLNWLQRTNESFADFHVLTILGTKCLVRDQMFSKG